MKPEVIIHNSISLDGSLTGFMPDMELHYRIAGEYEPDAHLIGSETIIAGNEMFGQGIPDEEPEDFNQPDRDTKLPWWVIVDSGGRLNGLLHTCRRFEYCRDVIVLVSESTPKDYLDYLDERNYRYTSSGNQKVNLRQALEILDQQYQIKRILTDTGRILGNLLLNEGLADEISLLVHPLLVGVKCYPMFSDVKRNPEIELKKCEKFDNGCLYFVYTVRTPK